MAKFGITVREILKSTIIVEAEDVNEAIRKVESAINQDKILLSCDDFDEREIEPYLWFGNGSGEASENDDLSYYLHLDDNGNVYIPIDEVL